MSCRSARLTSRKLVFPVTLPVTRPPWRLMRASASSLRRDVHVPAGRRCEAHARMALLARSRRVGRRAFSARTGSGAAARP
jgi:hypothetical protein